MVHHPHLTLLAHLRLSTATLHALGSQQLTEPEALQIPSIAELQSLLRLSAWQGLFADIRHHLAKANCLRRFELALAAA